MRILLLVPYAKYYVHFQHDLLQALLDQGHEVIAAAPDFPLGQAQLPGGVLNRTIPLRNTGLNPFEDLRSLVALTALLRETKPDRLLCYSLKPNLYGSLAARRAGVRRVHLFVTGLGYLFAEQTWKTALLLPFVKRLYARAIDGCERIYFENGDDAAELARLRSSVREKAVRVPGTGVNLARFQPAECKGTDGKPIVFLLVARLLKHKGVREFAAAARLLKPRYPQAVFRLVGPFDCNPSAIGPQEIEAWVRDGIVEYAGEAADVRPHLANASVFVLPSYYREGTPKAILEAMACGLPVITTDTPGCRDTVVPGENGFVVAPRSVSGLVQAIRRFLAEPELAARMGMASRRIAAEVYDVDRVNGIILTALGLPAGTERPRAEQAAAR